MPGDSSNIDHLYIQTPLIESTAISKRCSFKVYLKLENVQPTGTFKIRGISQLCKQAAELGYNHLVCSSGGNAGLAAAYAGRKLGMLVTIIVPQSTPKYMADKIRDEGAVVEIYGSAWDDANEKALKLSEQPGIMYIPPFDHPTVWEGHATMMEEILQEINHIPDAVVVSVGGGGLACGVLQGMKKIGWNNVPLVAMETVGADCFNAAIKANMQVTLPDITSIAKCLGAKTVCQRLLDYNDEHPIISYVVSDQEAVNACIRFVDDHHILVEPACGAALAAVYSNVLYDLHQQKKIQQLNSVVLIVCGGNMITFEDLKQWQIKFNLYLIIT